MPTKFLRLGLLAAGLPIVLSVCGTSTAAPKTREPQKTVSSTTVVIDAGHGGHDRGGIPGQKVPEKEMTLDVAQRLKALLATSGYHVVMTRDSDVFVPLQTRVAIANSYANAIFVCIHFNSAKRVGADGIETYFYGRDSLPLASAVHYYVAGGAPSPNRGVRRRGYYVLRKAKTPAVLVECGFLTNPTEAAYAQTVSYRQKLAEEIAAGIRGRSFVTSAPGASTRVATDESIPLQSYTDQTNVRSSSRSRSKRSHKKSSRAKSSTKKKSSTPDGPEASTTSKEREG